MGTKIHTVLTHNRFAVLAELTEKDNAGLRTSEKPSGSRSPQGTVYTHQPALASKPSESVLRNSNIEMQSSRSSPGALTGRATSPPCRIASGVPIVSALLVLAIVAVAALNHTDPLLPPVHPSTPFPHLVATTPHATGCGRDLVLPHLGNSRFGLPDSVSEEVSEAIRRASGMGTKGELIAAVGGDPFRMDEFENIPKLDGRKIEAVRDTQRHSTFMKVNPSDMSAPIMRGVRVRNQPPYDNREFLAVKVENIANGRVSTQVFHRQYVGGEFNQPWTTMAGPLVATTGRVLNTPQITLIGRLARGFAVRGENGNDYRLHC